MVILREYMMIIKHELADHHNDNSWITIFQRNIR